MARNDARPGIALSNVLLFARLVNGSLGVSNTSPPTSTNARPAGARRGVALLTALIFAIFIVLMFVTGVQFVTNAMKGGRNTKVDAQVYNVAMSGLTAATSWLQNHGGTSSVKCFDPNSNSNAPDETTETPAGEEQLGLVQEFQVDPDNHLWGRFEVGRSTTGPIPAPSRAPGVTSQGAKSPLYSASPGVTWTAEDVSLQRGSTLAGSVWRIRSRGYLFTRSSSTPFDPAEPFVATRPTLLKSMILEAEVRRGGLNFYQAAVYDYSTSANFDVHYHHHQHDCVINIGDGTAYVWQCNAGFVDTSGGDGPIAVAGPSSLSGSNPNAINYVDPSLTNQLAHIFNVPDMATLQAMATKYVDDLHKWSVTAPGVPQMYFIDTTKMPGHAAAFGNGGIKDLGGTGVLICNGELDIDGTNNPQWWNGLIFCQGYFNMMCNTKVVGEVILGGDARIHNLDNDVADSTIITYSASMLQQVNSALGTYQVMRSTIHAVDDATLHSY